MLFMSLLEWKFKSLLGSKISLVTILNVCGLQRMYSRTLGLSSRSSSASFFELSSKCECVEALIC